MHLRPLKEFLGPLISTYLRADAIRDGVLIDVSGAATEAGFRWPVAISRAAWLDCVEWSARDVERQGPQDEAGRLWDVLFLAVGAARAARSSTHRIGFELYRVPRDGISRRASLVKLKMLAHGGDECEPVVTIFLADEPED